MVGDGSVMVGADGATVLDGMAEERVLEAT